MHRSSSNTKPRLVFGLGLAALLFATAGMAQDAAATGNEQSRQVEHPLERLCADAPCSPPVLAGRYRIIEGPYAGSELRLDLDSHYSLTLEMSVMLRRFSGQWQLEGGMVLLRPDAAPGASVQLLSNEAASKASEGLRGLLVEMERGASSPAELAELKVLRAAVNGKHLPGVPVFVAVNDPMSGIAAEGVRVELQLEGGTILAGEDLPGGNDYRFKLPDDAVRVQSMVLHFPGLADPVRFQLDAPLRPHYSVLFDACDVGSCYSDIMGVVPDQRGGQWVMESWGVGVFVRTDAEVAK